MIYLVGLVLVVALTASLTRLVRTDRITAVFRVKIREKSRFFAELIECARCTSVWTAPFAVLPALAMAVAYLDLPWIAALIMAVPVSKAVAYLAYLLIMTTGDE